MNRLAAILGADDVAVGVVAENTSTLFVDAALIFQRHGWPGGLPAITDTLSERERLASTCLGHGVAIPHGRLKGLKSAAAAVVRLKEPLPFGGPDDEPVRLFVFLFVPEMATQADLEILGEIAEMLSDRNVRDRLKHEGDAASVFATIAGWTPARASGR